MGAVCPVKLVSQIGSPKNKDAALPRMLILSCNDMPNKPGDEQIRCSCWRSIWSPTLK